MVALVGAEEPVASVGDIVKVKSRLPAVGAGVAPGITGTGVSTGAGVSTGDGVWTGDEVLSTGAGVPSSSEGAGVASSSEGAGVASSSEGAGVAPSTVGAGVVDGASVTGGSVDRSASRTADRKGETRHERQQRGDATISLDETHRTERRGERGGNGVGAGRQEENDK